MERVCRFDELAIEGVLDWSAIWRWFGIAEGVGSQKHEKKKKQRKETADVRESQRGCLQRKR